MNLADHFAALDNFLTTHQHLWRPRPFYALTLDWEHTHPELSQWLRARTLEQAEACHNDPFSLNAPEPFASLAQTAQRLSQTPKAKTYTASLTEPVGVPGRKWQQIQAFAHALRFQQTPTHYLDWCAGKGHLGRHLARNGAALSLFEFDPYLVEQGALLSQKSGITAAHICQDVLAESAAERLSADMTPVALHACGDLHTQLVKLAATKSTQLAIAPCCYNRIHTSHYQPLCAQGRASSLHLSMDDLALPLSETVTAGQRVRRLRDQSMAWRLGFDLLQRQILKTDQYLPTPSLSSEWLNGSFADFCRHLAELKNVPLTGEIAWDEFATQGAQRLAIVRNLELVRALFRRPMELWLLLDKALYLQEHGFDCELLEFCPSALSPRNLLLQAQKPL